MSLVGPEPFVTNPFRRVWMDVVAERGKDGPYPPGELRPSLTRTHRMVQSPLGLLLEAYARYGPVFTLRVLHVPNVVVLGPEANHHILVSNFENFRWREGGFGDLIPLLGDGLLTIDGPFHRRSRQIMLPAFHRERIAEAQAVMTEEVERAIGRWEPGQRLDLYHWTRELALRIALRALFGIDPDVRRAGFDPARDFEIALAFYGREYWLQVLRGPGTPYAAMQSARRRLDNLIFGEIRRRRHSGERGEDILSLLLDAEDEDGHRLSDQHVRDEVMTLLFAGHDTTTATVTFLFWELASAPQWADRIAAGEEGVLDRCLDETLRLYPPAWIGPRRSVAAFEVCGVRVPGGVPVNYSSWASHRLPDVWQDPDAFDPDRFLPAARAALPKGAYVPFGGGSRQCIGMRFGQAEIRVIADRVLREFRLDPPLGHRVVIRQTPTLGPKDGLPVTVRAA